jgi:hypothetical protein
MSRATGVSALLAAVLMVCIEHTTAGQTANPAEDWCREPASPKLREGGRTNDRLVRHCEEREQNIAPVAALDVDPGRNGGIYVRGRTGPGIQLRTRIAATAPTEARARELASGVRVNAVSGRIRSDGPMTFNEEHWSTTFVLDVPRDTRLALNTHNGRISIEEFRGTANMRTQNGGIVLRDVGGDVKGYAHNGSLNIELTGRGWDGVGLDLETRNGPVRLSLPVGYSAELETGTVNGRVQIDFPVIIHAGRERRFTTTLGSGGPKIRAVTTNGPVRVSAVAGAQGPAPGSAFP